MSVLPNALEAPNVDPSQFGKIVALPGAAYGSAAPRVEIIRLPGNPKAGRVYTLSIARIGAAFSASDLNRGHLVAFIEMGGGAVGLDTFIVDVGPGVEIILPASTTLVSVAWNADAATIASLPTLSVGAWLVEGAPTSNAAPTVTVIEDAARDPLLMPLAPAGAINLPVFPWTRTLEVLRLTGAAAPFTLDAFRLEVMRDNNVVIDAFDVAAGARMAEPYRLPADAAAVRYVNTGGVPTDQIRFRFGLSM